MSEIDAVALCTAGNSVAIIVIAYQTLWRTRRRQRHIITNKEKTTWQQTGK
jgi:hypothetical protein